MMSTDLSEIELIRHIFFPNMIEAMQRVRQNGSKFVYYTTAATALKILRNKEIWMRSTRAMNDYMEVDHGLSCLDDAIRSDEGSTLQESLERLCPGAVTDAISRFKNWVPGIQLDTFVTCFSEHLPAENSHGRLSMWRAYGGSAGVALVLNADAMFQQSDALAAYTSPVAYVEISQMRTEFKKITDLIIANADHVKSMGKDRLTSTVFRMLRYAAICTKHPAFQEEREWRVIACPSLQSSPLVPLKTELIGDLPQRILKIKLDEYPNDAVVGLHPSQLIDRILIGPCEYPDVIWRAFHDVLIEAGASSIKDRIEITRIPLRPNQR